MVNYTLRVDEADKQKAEEVFETLGLSFASGINVYLKTVGRQQKIPFTLEINGNFPATKLQKAFRALQEEAKVNGVDNMTMDEINAEIEAYRQEKRGS